MGLARSTKMGLHGVQKWVEHGLLIKDEHGVPKWAKHGVPNGMSTESQDWVSTEY